MYLQRRPTLCRVARTQPWPSITCTLDKCHSHVGNRQVQPATSQQVWKKVRRQAPVQDGGVSEADRRLPRCYRPHLQLFNVAWVVSAISATRWLTAPLPARRPESRLPRSARERHRFRDCSLRPGWAAAPTPPTNRAHGSRPASFMRAAGLHSPPRPLRVQIGTW